VSDKALRYVQSELPGHCWRPGHERDLFSELADASDRKYHRDGKDGLPFPLVRLHVIPEPVPSLPFVPDVERFMGFERRINQKSKSASGLEYRAMTRMLLQEGPLTFAARLQAYTRAPQVGEEADFHLCLFAML
jgi:hypothetical protein